MRIFKICSRDVWEKTKETGEFPGMQIDIDDGYIHFSTAEQNSETLAKYFRTATNLMLLEVEADHLGEALVWEASSSGSRPGLFPHLYAPLKYDQVLYATPIEGPEASKGRGK